MNELNQSTNIIYFPTAFFNPVFLFVKIFFFKELKNSKCHKKIIVKYNNQIEEHIAYPYPINNNGKYEEVYCDVNINDVCIIRYISPEYIINIKNTKRRNR